MIKSVPHAVSKYILFAELKRICNQISLFSTLFLLNLSDDENNVVSDTIKV